VLCQAHKPEAQLAEVLLAVPPGQVVEHRETCQVVLREANQCLDQADQVVALLDPQLQDLLGQLDFSQRVLLLVVLAEANRCLVDHRREVLAEANRCLVDHRQEVLAEANRCLGDHRQEVQAEANRCLGDHRQLDLLDLLVHLVLRTRIKQGQADQVESRQPQANPNEKSIKRKEQFQLILENSGLENSVNTPLTLMHFVFLA